MARGYPVSVLATARTPLLVELAKLAPTVFEPFESYVNTEDEDEDGDYPLRSLLRKHAPTVLILSPLWDPVRKLGYIKSTVMVWQGSTRGHLVVGVSHGDPRAYEADSRRQVRACRVRVGNCGLYVTNNMRTACSHAKLARAFVHSDDPKASAEVLLDAIRGTLAGRQQRLWKCTKK